MTAKKLEIRGEIGLDSEFGYLQLIESGSSLSTGDDFEPGDSFISTLFQKHFLPNHRPSWEEQIRILNKILTLDGSLDSTQVRKEVEELDRLLVDYSNHFRILFEPLENQGAPLTLIGELYLSDSEISFESPSISGFLEKIFMDHYFPNQYIKIDDAEEHLEIDAGLFRLTFELIEAEPKQSDRQRNSHDAYD